MCLSHTALASSREHTLERFHCLSSVLYLHAAWIVINEDEIMLLNEVMKCYLNFDKRAVQV